MRKRAWLLTTLVLWLAVASAGLAAPPAPAPTTFPDTDVNWFNANGYTLLLSVKSERRNHTFVQWRDIAGAQPGSTLYNDFVYYTRVEP